MDTVVLTELYIFLGYVYRFYSHTDISTKTWYGLIKDVIDQAFQEAIIKFISLYEEYFIVSPTFL